MNIEQGAEFITQQIRSRNPFFVGKLGTSELDVLLFYTRYRQIEQSPMYPEYIKINIVRNGGLFPATDKALDAWAVHMLTEVLPAGTGYAIWNPIIGNIEKAILNTFASTAKQFPLRSLEPYYINILEDRWTYNLPKHAKVAVVSPFYKSIEHQWKKRDAIWEDNPIWGPIPPTIIPVRAGYSPYLSTTTGLWSTEIINGGWKAAVADIVRQVKETGARFAIVGCGALSLPICYALKKEYIASIHTGGATQILFGIKGRRWLNHSTISEFFNPAWEFPYPEEIPTQSNKVEGGCYWS
jgi:hypothetical protein